MSLDEIDGDNPESSYGSSMHMNNNDNVLCISYATLLPTVTTILQTVATILQTVWSSTADPYWAGLELAPHKEGNRAMWLETGQCG